MMKGYTNHRQAINGIAAQMNVAPKDVEQVIDAFFGSLRVHMRFPFVLRIPYIGCLLPDMRSHRHIEKRRERLNKMKIKKRK